MKSAFNKLRPNFWSRLAPSSDGDYFFVELEDAHRTWHPGDTVHGNVILVLYKPQRISSVDLIFAGGVVVKSALVKGKGSRSVLFEQKLRLHGSSSGNMNPGTTSTTTSTTTASTTSNMNTNTTASTNTNTASTTSTAPPVRNRSVSTTTNTPMSTSPVSTSSADRTSSTDLTRQGTRQSSDGSIWRSVGSSTPAADLLNSVTTEPVLSSRVSMHTTNSHASQMSRESHLTTDSHVSRESNASTSSTSEELEIGEHRFAFILEIPQKGLYNSLEFERGSISYVITAVAKRHGPLPAMHAKRVLQLVCPVDVARLPPPKPSTLSVEIQKRKKQQGIITTTLEVGRGGYLRGESFPVKISIQHVKSVKCLRGLVVTLCRFSKVTCNDDEPQSFRKDLSQTVSPLYTDPVTFASTVSTTLRIPPDVFPTTKGHGLVSFNYCVEVVIDLAGKWDLEEDRTGFLHTDRLKRNKGVVSLWTEVIIGTDRRRYRSDSHVTNSNNHVTASHNHNNHVHSPGHVNFGHVPSPSGSSSHNNHHASQSSSPGNHSTYSYHGHVSSHVTPGSSHTSGLSEKQLMKLREEALLPSEPASTSSPSLDAFPSAPEYVIEGEEAGSSSSAPSAPSAPVSSAPSDKHENELRRLQELSSDPYGDEDHVPQYKEKEKAPEEVVAMQLSELASVPPMEEEAGSSAPSAPPVNGSEGGFFDASSEFEPSAPLAFGHVHGHSHSSTGTIVNGENAGSVHSDTPSAPPVITHGFTGPVGPGVVDPGTASTTMDSLHSASSLGTPASTIPDTNKSLSDSDDIYS
ncbi:pH-response regulator protein palF/RIM8 [Yarrowia sp. B02]|nr:pH-response regulator protein palF/RIM8 [Yarrowia sp. B02]